ncbi:hypothetical protein [Bacteroides heparinolyticus]|uniref:Uncharacterized protein n=1 Tax=Prevotella heparinolytica TaxID=28113 RepID=A0A3P2A2F4_9BACE|nr:hypothetical protein [Bacteroides heparinolyticus]MCF0257504.1 hypothetical protein [Bacteroides heparinolyticus]RRD89036.1 hypothetical protein EII33_10795 [Bacteroides heparinolyticus]
MLFILHFLSGTGKDGRPKGASCRLNVCAAVLLRTDINRKNTLAGGTFALCQERGGSVNIYKQPAVRTLWVCALNTRDKRRKSKERSRAWQGANLFTA